MSKLQEINRKLLERTALSSRLAEIKEEILLVDRKKSKLDSQVQKELEDVLALEKLNVRRIFAQVLGDYKQMLEKERQEYLVAVLAHRSISEQLELLRYEENVLTQKLLSFENLDEEKKAAIKFKEINLKKRDNTFANNLYNFDKDIARKNSDIYNLEKTIKEGQKAKDLSFQILDDLNHVSKWGPSEMKGKGKLFKVYFEEESLNADLSEFEEFVSLFYDHLITDWVVQSKIKNSSQHIESQIDSIKSCEMRLQNKLAIEKSRLEFAQQERQKFIESF